MLLLYCKDGVCLNTAFTSKVTLLLESTYGVSALWVLVLFVEGRPRLRVWQFCALLHGMAFALMVLASNLTASDSALTFFTLRIQWPGATQAACGPILHAQNGLATTAYTTHYAGGQLSSKWQKLQRN